MPTKDEVIEVIKQCFDPEIPVNIWDLGLIYDIESKDNSKEIAIRMTLTAQACPEAQRIPEDIKSKISKAFEGYEAKIDLVFDPPWTPERITEAGKKKLGIETEE